MIRSSQLEAFTRDERPRDAAEQAWLDDAVAIQDAGLMLRRMREAAALTVDELAMRLHTPPAELLLLEQGRSLDGPSMSFFLRAAKACGASLDVSSALRHAVAT